jgi:putative tryptophan/tyrosine transport system substrate-binding protein
VLPCSSIRAIRPPRPHRGTCRKLPAPSGLQVRVLNAITSREIDAVFATLERERHDALFVAGGPFLGSPGVQIVSLVARDRIPAVYGLREYVVAGGLMSYGTNFADQFHQVGVYGSILKGANPAELPVLQPTKFEFVINLNTVKALGLTIPPSLLAIADEVIPMIKRRNCQHE